MQNKLVYKTFAYVVIMFVNVTGCNDDDIFNWTCVIDEAVLRKQGESFRSISWISSHREPTAWKNVYQSYLGYD